MTTEELPEGRPQTQDAPLTQERGIQLRDLFGCESD
jgi:hypothetical protein